MQPRPYHDSGRHGNDRPTNNSHLSIRFINSDCVVSCFLRAAVNLYDAPDLLNGLSAEHPLIGAAHSEALAPEPIRQTRPKPLHFFRWYGSRRKIPYDFSDPQIGFFSLYEKRSVVGLKYTKMRWRRTPLEELTTLPQRAQTLFGWEGDTGHPSPHLPPVRRSLDAPSAHPEKP